MAFASLLLAVLASISRASWNLLAKRAASISPVCVFAYSLVARAADMLRMVFRIWPDRHRQRRALRDMDDDQLYDLGITRSEAMRESQKPFWR